MSAHSPNPFLLPIIALVEQRTGLAVGAQLRMNLETILNDLAQDNPARFLSNLQSSPETAPSWQKLFHALAIGESYFFRHRPHFELFRNYILPTLIPQRRQQSQLYVNVWSAGCATGEEPYSIAIALSEYLPDLSRWTLNLVGTDINMRALQVAQRGIYRNWSFRHTDNTFRQTYFQSVPDGMQLKSSIRSQVSFQYNNLLSKPPLAQLDVIFCCNVLIYFEDHYIQPVEDMFFEALAPGGWLILGQGESIRFQRKRWMTHILSDVVVFQKPSAALNRPPRVPPVQKPAPSGETEVAAVYQDAVAAFRLKQYDQAERSLMNILVKHLHYAPAYVLLACICANLQRPAEAHKYLDTALAIDPLQADAYYLRGMLHLENEQFEAAKEALRASIYCKRGHALSAMILGHLYTYAGEMNKARRTWEEALLALKGLPPERLVSELGDWTVSSVESFLSSQLNDLCE